MPQTSSTAHNRTASSRITFNVEMGRESDEQTFTLGRLLVLTTEQIQALSDEALEARIREAYDEWQATQVSGGWSFE